MENNVNRLREILNSHQLVEIDDAVKESLATLSLLKNKYPDLDLNYIVGGKEINQIAGRNNIHNHSGGLRDDSHTYNNSQVVNCAAVQSLNKIIDAQNGVISQLLTIISQIK